MKKYWLFLILGIFLVCPINVGAQSYPSPAPELTRAQHKNATKLYRAICKRLSQCRPDIVDAKSCKDPVTAETPFVQTLPRGALGASGNEVRKCTKSVASVSCHEFLSDTAPPGCEFFRY